MPIIEIQKKVDLFGWDFDEANILAIKIDEILDDIIRQVRDRESKIVVFINNDHQITNWEILICKK